MSAPRGSNLYLVRAAIRALQMLVSALKEVETRMMNDAEPG